MFMSDTEISRIMTKLDLLEEKQEKISIDLAEVKTTLRDYNVLNTKVNAHEYAIGLINQRCDSVQAAKRINAVPWGNVKGQIIGGIFLLAAGIAIGFFI